MNTSVTFRNTQDGAGDTYFSTLYFYRHLFINMVAADMRARFRRRYLGVLWAMLQPIGFALVISYVWHLLFHHDMGYFAVHVMSGLIVWEFFTGSINRGLNALGHGKGYLRQARLPLFLFQARVPCSEAVTFLFALAGFFILQIFFQNAPPLSFSILLLIPFVAITMVLCLPLAIIFSILGAQLRDLQHITSMALRALFFCSPILAERERFERPGLEFLAWANPVMPLMDMFRDPAIDGRWWDPFDLMVVAIWAAVLWGIALIMATRTGRHIVYSV
jgi:lipopolysaccharide transport system permease protein